MTDAPTPGPISALYAKVRAYMGETPPGIPMEAVQRAYFTIGLAETVLAIVHLSEPERMVWMARAVADMNVQLETVKRLMTKPAEGAA